MDRLDLLGLRLSELKLRRNFRFQQSRSALADFAENGIPKLAKDEGNDEK